MLNHINVLLHFAQPRAKDRPPLQPGLPELEGFDIFGPNLQSLRSYQDTGSFNAPRPELSSPLRLIDGLDWLLNIADPNRHFA